MNILVLYDTEIKVWLVGEPIESIEDHIKNGYPDLIGSFEAGALKAEVIDVPDEDAFRGDLYEVRDGQILRIAEKEGINELELKEKSVRKL